MNNENINSENNNHIKSEDYSHNLILTSNHEVSQCNNNVNYLEPNIAVKLMAKKTIKCQKNCFGIVDKWQNRMLVELPVNNISELIERETSLLKVKYPFLPERQLKGKVLENYGIPTIMGNIARSCSGKIGKAVTQGLLNSKMKKVPSSFKVVIPYLKTQKLHSSSTMSNTDNDIPILNFMKYQENGSDGMRQFTNPLNCMKYKNILSKVTLRKPRPPIPLKKRLIVQFKSNIYNFNDNSMEPLMKKAEFQRKISTNISPDLSVKKTESNGPTRNFKEEQQTCDVLIANQQQGNNNNLNTVEESQNYYYIHDNVVYSSWDSASLPPAPLLINTNNCWIRMTTEDIEDAELNRSFDQLSTISSNEYDVFDAVEIDKTPLILRPYSLIDSHEDEDFDVEFNTTLSALKEYLNEDEKLILETYYSPNTTDKSDYEESSSTGFSSESMSCIDDMWMNTNIFNNHNDNNNRLVSNVSCEYECEKRKQRCAPSILIDDHNFSYPLYTDVSMDDIQVSIARNIDFLETDVAGD